MKNKKEQAYYEGDVYGDDEHTVTIKKVYPPGHRFASLTSFGYLIDSTDLGEDELLEFSVGRIIRGLRKLTRRREPCIKVPVAYLLPKKP